MSPRPSLSVPHLPQFCRPQRPRCQSSTGCRAPVVGLHLMAWTLQLCSLCPAAHKSASWEPSFAFRLWLSPWGFRTVPEAGRGPTPCHCLPLSLLLFFGQPPSSSFNNDPTQRAQGLVQTLGLGRPPTTLVEESASQLCPGRSPHHTIISRCISGSA